MWETLPRFTFRVPDRVYGNFVSTRAAKLTADRSDALMSQGLRRPSKQNNGAWKLSKSGMSMTSSGRRC
jgi:hypothetical protein